MYTLLLTICSVLFCELKHVAGPSTYILPVKNNNQVKFSASNQVKRL